MKAHTHTEVYRPYRGELRRRALRSVTLAWSGIRVGLKRKLPMLLLFAVPTISTIVGSFQIQLRFDAMSGNLTLALGEAGDPRTEMMSAAVARALADVLGDVEVVILAILRTLQFFVVLAMGWYGAGLIAEDKRLRAHLLYFARPITRGTYLRGKLGTVVFWGACVVLVPISTMVSTAAFASPDWSFVTERWRTILQLYAYGSLWVAVHALLVLAISSVCRMRNQALAGLFGFYFLTSITSEILAWLFEADGWRLLSIPRNFERIAEAFFGGGTGEVTWAVEATVWALGGLCALCLVVLDRQTRRMELGQ